MKLGFRRARERDIPTLISMLVDDELGRLREDLAWPPDRRYLQAFAEIEKDPNNELIVAENGQQPVGMLQLTFIPYLTYMGAWRGQVEGVRIHRDFRGHGLGTRLIEWAIARSKEKGCVIMQLTSDKQRKDAIRFYQNLGFQATHEGLKLKLE